MAEPYISEIRLFSFNFAPKYWAFCNGTLMSIAQNQALFALLGTTYGGNGVQTFGLPDLRGRAAIHESSTYPLGAPGGTETVTLSIGQLPPHNHMFNGSSAAGTELQPVANSVPGTNSANNSFYGPPNQLQPLIATSVGMAGQSQPHNNMQPYLTLNYCVAIYGAFPSRN